MITLDGYRSDVRHYTAQEPEGAAGLYEDLYVIVVGLARSARSRLHPSADLRPVIYPSRALGCGAPEEEKGSPPVPGAIARFADGVLEAGWLMALGVVPAFFNVQPEQTGPSEVADISAKTASH